jgi:hypothetical protein
MSASTVSFDSAEREYDEAWDAPNHTRFELPPVNVNQVLRDRYRMSPSQPLTRRMIWDMERKKAWDPLSYIPYVVSEGRSWDRRTLRDGTRRFNRASMQRGWISDEIGQVLEDVFVSDAKQVIYFIGRLKMLAESGEELTASAFQPLFHVRHAVGGMDDEPLNLWSIVLLTSAPDGRYLRPFEDMVRAGWLPGFVEIYIKRDLDRQLSRN